VLNHGFSENHGRGSLRIPDAASILLPFGLTLAKAASSFFRRPANNMEMIQ
jgi:hypothetical protein